MRSLVKIPAWIWALVVTALLGVTYIAFPMVEVQDSVTVIAGGLAVIAMLVGIFWHRPNRPGIWLLLCASVAAAFLGDVIWGFKEIVLNDEVPFPSVADAFYLAAYPLSAAGLWAIARSLLPRRSIGALIDIAIVTCGVAIISWEFLIEPALSSGTISASARFIAAAYPAMGLFLFAALVAIIFRKSTSPTVVILLGLGILVESVSDSVFAFAVSESTYATGTITDVGWLTMFGLWGSAALHPTMRHVEISKLADRPTHNMMLLPRLVLMLTACLVAPTAMVFQDWLGIEVKAWEAIIESVILWVLVFGRIGVLAQALQRSERKIASKHENLSESYRERNKLLREMVQTIERERLHIASELHDGPVQRLTGLGYLIGRLEMNAAKFQDPADRNLVSQVSDDLCIEIHRLRKLMQELRPPALSESGLASALGNLRHSFEHENAIPCSLTVRLHERLDSSAEAIMYRVVQEALVNIGKHAHANNVKIALTQFGREVCLEVSDDGVGFEPLQQSVFIHCGHFGLAIMRERVEALGGDWSVTSAPGKGTTLIAMVPVLTHNTSTVLEFTGVQS